MTDMTTDATDFLPYELPKAKQSQTIAFGMCTDEALPMESTLMSFPIPTGEPGQQQFHCLAFPTEVDLEWGESYCFQPAMSVVVDANTQEVISHHVLHEWNPQTEEPIGYQYSQGAVDAYFEYVDFLEEELFWLCEVMLDYWGRTDLSDEERQGCQRFDAIFRFLVSGPLLEAYEAANPDFFKWLNTQCGTPLPLVENTDMPPVDYSVPLPTTYIPPYPDAALPMLLNPVEGLRPWSVNDATLDVTLKAAGLTPAAHSPLADLTPQPEDEDMAVNLFELIPEDLPEGRDVLTQALSTLCQPTLEVVHTLTDALGHGETRLYINEAVLDESGAALWVRCTQTDEGLREIAAGLTPHRIKRAMVKGLQVAGVTHAKQIIHTLSMNEMAVLLALADLKAQSGQRTLKEVTVEQLESIWHEKPEEPESDSGWWTDVCRGISPIQLDVPPQALIQSGVAELLEQGRLEEHDGTLTVGRELLNILRSVERPEATSTLYVHSHQEDGSLEVEGFSAIRTKNYLWLWEHSDDYALEQASGQTTVNFFMGTGRQLAQVIDDVLEIDEPPPPMPGSEEKELAHGTP